MLLRRRGRIINITSPSADDAAAGQANYAASKAGLVGLTRALSRDLARRGVLVNAVSPGLIETDMLASMPEATRQATLERDCRWAGSARCGRSRRSSRFSRPTPRRTSSGQVIAVDGGLT